MKSILKKSVLVSSVVFSGLVMNAQSVQEEIPIADMLDSLSSQKMFEAAFQRPSFNKHNKYDFSEDSIPVYDDNTYTARLAKLDAQSPFDLIYNPHVKGFIDLYTVRKRESVCRMMGISQLYYPMFEE